MILGNWELSGHDQEAKDAIYVLVMVRATCAMALFLGTIPASPVTGQSPGPTDCGLLFGNPVFEVNVMPTSVATGDLDGDGDVDLAAATGGGISVLLNNGDGTFAPDVQYVGGRWTQFCVAIGDLDGDGDAGPRTWGTGENAETR